MSERDLKRIEILSEVLAGRRTVVESASALGITERHAYRLLSKYQEEGGTALAHKARGRESNRSLNPGIRKYALKIVQTRYAAPLVMNWPREEERGPTVGPQTV